MQDEKKERGQTQVCTKGLGRVSAYIILIVLNGEIIISFVIPIEFHRFQSSFIPHCFCYIDAEVFILKERCFGGSRRV